uniref:DUF4149 domain-containing protein n=1 Tax=Strongyloides venezuelensis TaxID=75913 RepID=A0A0K0FVL4_STRVS
MQVAYCFGSCLASVISVIIAYDLHKSTNNPLVASALLNKINIPVILGNFPLLLITLIKKQYLPLIFLIPITLWHVRKIQRRPSKNICQIYDSTTIVRKNENKKNILELIFKGGYYSMLMIMYTYEFFSPTDKN